jgi:acetylornithine deacetylase/succinyl-diaminopimelate desuccinylase-like protein
MNQRSTVLPVMALLSILAACTQKPPPAMADAANAMSVAREVERPVVTIPEGAGFSPGDVLAYTGDHPAVYAHIEANQAEHLANLQRWVQQRSISAQNDGILEMAELLRSDLEALGFDEAQVVPTTGHPGVWGFYDAGAVQTLAVYMMYDVQPVEPNWQVDPFAGALVDTGLGTVLMARGATNQKGPERAFLNALASIIATDGTLPVNLMVLAEGEEELGSPHYPELIERYADRLRTAKGVMFPGNGQNRSGAVGLALGVKGIIYFEIEAHGSPDGGPMKAEIHGSLKALVDAPALRLAQAISSLVSIDGNTIRVPGYYDPIRAPSEEEIWVFNGSAANWPAREGAMQESLSVERWIDGMTGRDSYAQMLFTTTLNIDGIYGGYTGEGVKTILPHQATAKMDSRLVPDQDPDQALDMIRAHLAAEGFDDIEVRKVSGYPPAQSSVEAPLVHAALSVYNKYTDDLTVTVRSTGSAPYYVFTDILGLPMVRGGIGHGSGAHAPNEYMVIEPAEGSPIAGLVEVEKYYADLVYALAR